MFHARDEEAKRGPEQEVILSQPVSTHPSPSPQVPNPDIEKQSIPASQAKTSAFSSLGLLDRFLALWIFLAMVIGILLGNFVPNTGPVLQKGKFVGVSIPIAIGLLIMMYPILCKIKFESLHLAFRNRQIWVQIAFSVVVNWVIAPFLMLGLAWAFLPDKEGLRVGFFAGNVGVVGGANSGGVGFFF